MASMVDHTPPAHSPPGPDAKRPKGILKNPSQQTVPTTTTTPAPAPVEKPHQRERSMSSKEVTIENTHFNAGHRRSSSAARQGPGSRRQSSHGHPADADGSASQRLQWDEANLYLTEQERTATMKIDEPKTPYAKHYDPAEDPSDEEMEDPMEDVGAQRARRQDDIPDLTLGEPEEAIPERTPSAEKRAHVDNESVGGHGTDGEDMIGLSAEEREKHRKFEEARKRHYEMKNVAELLGNPEDLPEDEEDDEDIPPPPMPPLPKGINGSK